MVGQRITYPVGEAIVIARTEMPGRTVCDIHAPADVGITQALGAVAESIDWAGVVEDPEPPARWRIIVERLDAKDSE